VTFKNAETVRRSALEVPLSQLLVETDCPFLAPTPFRGKRNEPAHVQRVAQTLAELLQIPLEDLAQQTSQNAARLFRLPQQGDGGGDPPALRAAGNQPNREACANR
jgi:TatD DNase family protein